MKDRNRTLSVDGDDALRPFRPGKDGEWDRAAAAHLARRAGFGMPPRVIRDLLELGPTAAVDRLVKREAGSDNSKRLLGTARSVNSLESAQSWWTHRLLHGGQDLREKLALFWHGHLATSDQKVNNARLMLDQLMLFRRGGLGPFGDLVQAVATDPAMLIYLDGNSNRVGRPNENFARELMELFTLGIGNYTEADIKEAARAFTGWHVRGISFWFNRNAHDFGSKRVLGHDGVQEGDEVVDICVKKRASARFIAGKLFRFFVHPDPDEALLERLAGVYEESGGHIGRYLGTLLSSRLFYRADVRRSIIASPVDFVIGTLRTLAAGGAPARLIPHLERMGQDLFRPPGVKGWDGGRAWISSTTVLARLLFCVQLAEGSPIGARVPWEDLAAPGEPLLEGLFSRLFPGELDGGLREELRRFTAGHDRGAVLAAVLQLPEYQMI